MEIAAGHIVNLVIHLICLVVYSTGFVYQLWAEHQITLRRFPADVKNFSKAMFEVEKRRAIQKVHWQLHRAGIFICFWQAVSEIQIDRSFNQASNVHV